MLFGLWVLLKCPGTHPTRLLKLCIVNTTLTVACHCNRLCWTWLVKVNVALKMKLHIECCTLLTEPAPSKEQKQRESRGSRLKKWFKAALHRHRQKYPAARFEHCWVCYRNCSKLPITHRSLITFQQRLLHDITGYFAFVMFSSSAKCLYKPYNVTTKFLKIISVTVSVSPPQPLILYLTQGTGTFTDHPAALFTVSVTSMCLSACVNSHALEALYQCEVWPHYLPEEAFFLVALFPQNAVFGDVLLSFYKKTLNITVVAVVKGFTASSNQPKPHINCNNSRTAISKPLFVLAHWTLYWHQNHLFFQVKAAQFVLHTNAAPCWDLGAWIIYLFYIFLVPSSGYLLVTNSNSVHTSLRWNSQTGWWCCLIRMQKHSGSFCIIH